MPILPPETSTVPQGLVLEASSPRGPAQRPAWWTRLRHPKAQEQLHRALDERSAEQASLALRNGARLDPGPLMGEPVLLDAARTGRGALVTLLLDQGVNLEARHPENGRTALLVAVLGNHADLVTLLVQRGANLDHLDDQHDSIWSLAHRLTATVGTWPNGPKMVVRTCSDLMLEHLTAMRQARIGQDQAALRAVFDETTKGRPPPPARRRRL